VAPGGAVWFTDPSAHRIGRITPSGAVVEYAVHDSNSRPVWIAAAADGGAWFTEPWSNRIGRITPAGAIAEFPVSTLLGVAAGGFGTFLSVQPWDIVQAPDGDLWFTELNANRIGRMTPRGAVHELQLPRPTGALAFAADGGLWYTSANDGHLSHFDRRTIASL
jgi:virginiamycin B lyase